jgi:Zn-dependent protease with chaperone function
MVVLHELAHCIRSHAWIRIVPTVVVVPLLFIAMTFLTGIWLSIVSAGLFLLFVSSLIAVCWWTEFDADRVAIEIAVQSSTPMNRDLLLQRHSEELSKAIRKIYGERNMHRRSWMHPSGSKRLDAIHSYGRLPVAIATASSHCVAIADQAKS